MKKIISLFALVATLLVLVPSCVKDLDTVPLDKDVLTPDQVFSDPASYKAFLAKLYAGLSVSGQSGPSGDADISGIDEGFGQYLRGYFYHQQLTTDETVMGWNDQTIKDFHGHVWGSGDNFIAAMYYRIFYQISVANEFIRETTDEKLDSRGVSGDLRTQIAQFRAEARFLRALSYWHALDLFGNVPFVTEKDKVGAFFPQQIQRAALFEYVETELLAIEPEMVGAKSNEYGRADKAAVWTLLAKLYLNAEVYTGTQRYADVVEYSSRVINAGYTLEDKYENLFLADNDQCDEVIFPVTFDGTYTKTWGGTTFIIHAAVGGDMNPADFGIDGGWGGIRTTKSLVQKFYPDVEKGLKVSPTPKSVKDYPVLYVPGSYQDWNPANPATVIASVLSDGKYEGYFYFAAGDQFKFTDGPTWDVNYGDTGADGTLDPGGDNISVSEPGVYKINVDLPGLTYTIVKTNWGLIGDATPGGWTDDLDMTYDAASGMLSVVAELTTGSVKFRANDGWDINLGDTGLDGILEYGGENIPIADAGTYTVSLKVGPPDYTYTIVRSSFDKRAMFHSAGQNLEINDIGTFTEGWAVTKFKNLRRDGTTGSNLTHTDTDFPMFRLADVYLMYAEAVLRGGGGSLAEALNYVNALRTRAYGDDSGNITATELKLEFILDERARELYWEAHRRTDLIRFGKFTTGDYHWPWKGNVPDGTATSSHLNIFPIPSSDIGANPNLQQNPNY